jgi:tetratricopeptide (TPR) repeat protein
MVGLACALSISVAGGALAQSSDEDARRHFEAGVSYFNTSEYEDALREFQRSYQLSEVTKRPAILRNIAAVYERMGHLEKTVETLEQYLREDPNTEEKATVELRIANLKERIAKQDTGQEDAVVPTPPPGLRGLGRGRRGCPRRRGHRVPGEQAVRRQEGRVRKHACGLLR